MGYAATARHALVFQQKLQDAYGGLVTLVEGDIADPEARSGA